MVNHPQADLLYEVAREFTSTLDLDQVLRRVLQVTTQSLGAEQGFFFLLDPAGRAVRRFVARTDASVEEIESTTAQVLERGLAGWALYHREVALAADTSADERWIQPFDASLPTGSALVVPLVHGEQVNGLLTLFHSHRNFFTPQHAALAEAIAMQAAIAVENARLHGKVQQERAALEYLIAHLPEPLLLITRSGKVLVANRAASELWAGIDLSTANFHDLFTALQTREAFAQAYKTGAVQHFSLPWEDGRYFDVSIAFLPEVGVVIFLHDVTALERLNVLKSQLVATASHDLKNPLSWIYGYAAMLDLEEDLSPTAAQCVRGILSSIAKMQALIDDLLDLYRIEGRGPNSRPGKSDVTRAIQTVYHEAQASAFQKQQQIIINVPDHLPEARIEPLRLAQVLDNLVSNAIKYTHAGGRILIAAELQDNGILVRVEDNGPGIPQEAMEHLFEQFFRIDREESTERAGTGLGLSIVRAIIQDCGGKVGVQSQEGQGSTFWFWLPLAKEPGADPSAS